MISTSRRALFYLSTCLILLCMPVYTPMATYSLTVATGGSDEGEVMTFDVRNEATGAVRLHGFADYGVPQHLIQVTRDSGLTEEQVLEKVPGIVAWRLLP